MNNKLTRYDSDDFFSGNWLKNFFDLPSLSGSNILKTNIRKGDNNYIYEIDIPRYSKDEVNISYENGYLVVEAKTKKDDGERILRADRHLQAEILSLRKGAAPLSGRKRAVHHQHDVGAV